MKKLLLILLLCSMCVGQLGHSEKSNFSPSLLSFNNGQVSPLLEARTDYQKYSSSCRTVENMFATTQGPVQRRPGTKYISNAFESGDYGYGIYGAGDYLGE